MGLQDTVGIRGMKGNWFFIFFCIVFCGLNLEAWAVLPLPHTVYGSVKRNGIDVPDGTVVSAWIGGVQYDSAFTTTFGGNSVFVSHIPGDQPDTAEKEGGVQGEFISFRVGSDGAEQGIFFLSGGGTNVNLTADPMLSDVSVAQDTWCGGKARCLSSIQSAVHSAASYTLIDISAEVYEEDVTLDSSKVLILQGGWNVTFTTHLSSTTINGSLSILAGKLIVGNLILE